MRNNETSEILDIVDDPLWKNLKKFVHYLSLQLVDPALCVAL